MAWMYFIDTLSIHFMSQIDKLSLSWDAQGKDTMAEN
jgi:hypothetical protein